MLRGLEWEIQTAQSAIIGLPVSYRTYRRDIYLSERDYSVAGNTVTNKRNMLSAENVHNLVFLHGCHRVG